MHSHQYTAPFLSILFALAICSCDRQTNSETEAAPFKQSGQFRPHVAEKLEFHPEPAGEGVVGYPWVSDLQIVDLDQDGIMDIVFSEGRLSQLKWLRSDGKGNFEETLIDDTVAGPANIHTVDVDDDGDIDIALAGMGIITPNDQRIGTFSIFLNDGHQKFERVAVLKDVPRANVIGSGDLNGDGLIDFVVGMFGYFEGETRVLINRGNYQFDSKPISMQEGAMGTSIVDFDQDGDLDIALQISQDWEEIFLYENDGDGNFQQRLIWGTQNKDYGSSGMVDVDLDNDGWIDLVFTNGDGFDYATPGSRPWHGVQWLRNVQGKTFEFKRIGDQLGSYSPVVADFDNDNDLDIIVTSGFNDWTNPDALSLVCFRNDGHQHFEKVPLAKSPTHLIVLDAGDLDGDGKLELVTGALHFYPPYDKLSRLTLWRR